MPVIAFYIGYSPDFNGGNANTLTTIGGSEHALVHIAEGIAASNKYDVHVFGWQTTTTPDYIHGVKWHNASEFNDFMKSTPVDTLIISRYINCYLHHYVKARKVYLWLHDVVVHPAYQGKMLEENAGVLLYNLISNEKSNIKGISAQSEWHMNLLRNELYPFLKVDASCSQDDLLFLAPNGIDEKCLRLVESEKCCERRPNSFIFAAHHVRGITNIMRMWPLILEKFKGVTPPPSLTVCGEPDSSPEGIEQLRTFTETYKDSVTVFGKIPHTELFKKLMETEVWWYPTTFPETYCMLALEAQLAGCFCIASDSGSLKLTIGNRGVIVNQGVSDDMWVDVIHKFLTDEQQYVNTRKTLQERAVEWAKKQTWQDRVERVWLPLLEE